MRKMLKIFKACILTSTVSLSVIACNKLQHENENYTDISGITMETINVAVNLNNNEIYDTALSQVKENIKNKINSLLTKGKEVKYYVDYRIQIINHDIYEKIKKLELLDITVFATNDSNILQGEFKAQLNLVPERVDISSINIDKQAATIKENTTTFQQVIAGACLLLIQKQITDLVPTAKLDNDYVVNVEGHELVEVITKLESVYINVNAVEDDYHFLLHGSFTFILTFIAA